MYEEIVGTSTALRAVLPGVSKVAPTDSTVLITGSALAPHGLKYRIRDQ
jgi:transcriptional regulator with GAF, ATPase, and Fis domain